MSSEFEAISTPAEWSLKLAELLAAARLASESTSESDRLDVVRRLTGFIEASYPASPEIVALDEIAASAARRLSMSIGAHAVDRIAARTASIESLATDLAAIADASSDSGDSVGLTSEKRLAGALADAARSISDLSSSPPLAHNQTLRVSLIELLDAIATIQKRIASPKIRA